MSFVWKLIPRFVWDFHGWCSGIWFLGSDPKPEQQLGQKLTRERKSIGIVIEADVEFVIH